MKCEIYYDEKTKKYTLHKTSDSIKKKPLKFKLKDSTSRFRKQQLKESILSSHQ